MHHNIPVTPQYSTQISNAQCAFTMPNSDSDMQAPTTPEAHAAQPVQHALVTPRLAMPYEHSHGPMHMWQF